MPRAFKWAAVVSVLVLAALPAFAIQLITNGGFETGDFTGWNVVDQADSAGSWYVASGTTTPGSNRSTAGPASGTYYAVSDQGEVSCSVLYQTFTVPANEGELTLSYDLFANNYDGSYVDPAGLDYTTPDPNQYCTVDLLYGGSDVFTEDPTQIIFNPYLGDDGPNPPYPWTHYSYSGTLDPGSYILRFAFVANQANLNMGVDNVSVDFTPNAQVPEPSSLLLLLTALPFGIILKRRGKAA